MFFYRKKSNSGHVLQLLESYRNRQGNSTHRVVVSPGDAALPEKSWKSVAKFVESKLYGYTEWFSPPADEQVWIDSIVKRIEREGKWPGKSNDKTLLGSRCPQEQRMADAEVVDGVLIDEIEHSHETTLGPELVGLKAWDDLGLDALLERLGFSGVQRRSAACSVINRLVDPVSEHRLPMWLQTSSLPDILGEDCLHSASDKYYKVSDLLYENHEEIEKYLSEKIAHHFGFQRTYILYDLTNSHFEGECLGNEKAKRGRNKQKRNDCVQIVVGVCFDEHGFVLFHKSFAGNMSDSKSLLEMVSAMQTCSKETNLFTSQMRPLVIVDAGIATVDNVNLLREKGFSYLVNETRKGRKKYENYFNEHDRFNSVRKGEKELTVKIRKLAVCDGEIQPEEPYTLGAATQNAQEREENPPPSPADIKACPSVSSNSPTEEEREHLKECLVLCRSKPRKAKEQAIFSGAEKKLLEALKKLSLRIAKGQLKDTVKIQRCIGKIQGRHTRAANHYEISYQPPQEEAKVEQKKKTGKKKSDSAKPGTFSYTHKEQKDKGNAEIVPDSLLGCYVLRSDQCGISAEQLWHLYMTLSKAEDGFRALKSDCGLRPNHHQLEHRVDAHIFISILAYQLQRFILYQLEQQHDHRSWSTLRRVLQTHSYSTIIVPTNKGKTYRIRKPGMPEECQRHIYNLLGVNLGHLPKTKIMTKKKSPTL